MALDPDLAGRLTRNADGLFCVVAQERTTGKVLMVAWMDDEALERTLATRQATYFSRSRQQYWVKGETSGHTQYVHDAHLDCDGDTLLLIVDQVGPACHTGKHSCFDTASLPFADQSTVDRSTVDQSTVDQRAAGERAGADSPAAADTESSA